MGQIKNIKLHIVTDIKILIYRDMLWWSGLHIICFECFLSCLVWSPLVCDAFTHWFLENGRIYSEANSIFRLHTPADLILFISQGKAADELRSLDKQSQELLRQQDILKSVENDHLDREKIVFATDPDCLLAKKKLSKFDLYLSSFLRLEAKKIKMEEFLDYKGDMALEREKPYCDSEFLFSMSSYDHLKGVSARRKLTNSAEYGLVNPIPQAKDLSNFGHRIKVALAENATS